ncbi:T9SS type A sorting domain-containing protein [bacterium]|nr:T9SS type A sorting domain-containing protein [bacterium]
MKKLFYSGLMALTMLFAMPGVVRAEDEGGATTTVSAPSFTNAGAVVTGEALKIEWPEGLESYHDYRFIIYVENDETTELKWDGTLMELSAAMRTDGPSTDLDDDDDEPAVEAPAFKIAMYDADEEEWMKPVTLSSTGTVKVRARMAVAENQNSKVELSEEFDAIYTVTERVITTPTFYVGNEAVAGNTMEVESGATLTFKHGYETEEDAQYYTVLYVVDGTDEDFEDLTGVKVQMYTGEDDAITIEKAQTIKAVTANMGGDISLSEIVTVAFTIKSETPDPATPGVFTFTPAPSETAMDAGTKITVVYSDATRDIYYQWFVDEATAKAATFDEDWAWITGDFKPELTAAKPVLKVVALDDDEEVIADSVVVYVVKAAPALPTLDLTFNPVSGSSVAPSAKITVEIAELGEGEELDYKWFETKEEADAAQWDMDWFIYEDDQPEAYLERGLDKDTLYLKVALVEVDEDWNGTVKGYGQATYIVDIELVDKIVITPANKTLVREGDSVNIEVVFGGEATEGTLVYKWYETINAANVDMNFMTTAQTYNNAIKPVITRANPILMVGYKNAEGWLIKPVTVEYFFDPVVTGFTVEAAGKNEMKEDTVVFDGMASFVFHTEGNVINGLQVAAKLYSKDYSDTITTNSYDATDTLAQFVGLYNGEYVVNFSLRHAYASDKDSVMADTTIYFNVTNYAEPVNPVDPELTVEAAGKHTTIADTIVFNEAAFALQIAGELIENDSLGNYTVSIEVYTQAAYDAWEEADTTYVYGADTINGKTVEFAALEEGRYVARFFLTRINGLMPEELEGAQEIFFQITTEEINTAIETNELAGVNVYPNPNAGAFNVVVPENARIEIFGLNGAKVMSREVNAGVEAFQLNHSGIYFVRVMAGNKTAVKRVVVR